MSSSNERSSVAGSVADRNLTIDEVRRSMEQIVIAYSVLVDAAGENLPILSVEHEVTATNAARAASALLGAVNLEVFELAMWEEFGGRPMAMPQDAGDSEDRKGGDGDG